MHQITIRKVSDPLYQELIRQAKQKKSSMNKTIISMLNEKAGITENSERKRNLSKLANTWTNNEVKEFEDHTAIFEKIDPEIWK